MNIPDKAYEAAREALVKRGLLAVGDAAEIALEVAAPYIAAQALREFEESIERWIHMEGPIDSADVLEDIRNTYGPR